MLYMVTFTINISPMLAYIPYMDPMGSAFFSQVESNHRRIENGGQSKTSL